MRKASHIVGRLLEDLWDVLDAEARYNAWEVRDLTDKRVFYLPLSIKPEDMHHHLIDGHQYEFRRVVRSASELQVVESDKDDQIKSSLMSLPTPQDQLLVRGFVHSNMLNDFWEKRLGPRLIGAYELESGYWVVAVYNEQGIKLTWSDIKPHQIGPAVDRYEGIILKGATEAEIKNLPGFTRT